MKRMRKRKQLKFKHKIILVIILIISFTFFWLFIYLKKSSNKIIELATLKIDTLVNQVLSEDVSYDLLKEVDKSEIIKISKNTAGEILNVDFNLEESYKILDNITTKVSQKMDEIATGKIKTTDKNIIRKNNSQNIILKFPLFITSNSPLFSNFGPNIYLGINFNKTILTNLKTRITNYGLNNALVEMYVPIEITYELLSPINNVEKTINYEVLIASKIINGRVPYYYGDEIIKESNIITKN